MRSIHRKVFYILFFSIFCAVTGVGIVVPLLPVYAHDLGAGGFYIGLIFGAFSLSRTCLLPFFGKWSDQSGRKPFLVLGLFAYALISVAFVYSRQIESLILIRFIQGIASAMIMPVAQAYVGDITPVGREGFTMGLFNLSVFLGLSIGPLLGGIINDAFNLDMAFVCMGVLALAGCLLCLSGLPPLKKERLLSRKNTPVKWTKLLVDREIAVLFSFRLVYTLCIGIIWGFLPIFANSAVRLSGAETGLLVMLGVFTSGILNGPMGFVADRINRNLMVVSGGLITAFAIFSFEWAMGFWDLFWANVLFGIGGGIAMPALMALAVLKGNETKSMGSVMALMTMGHSMGMLAGALLAGIIMDVLGLRPAFMLGALIMAVGVALFFVSARSRPPCGVKGQGA